MPDLNLLVGLIKACENDVTIAEKQHTLAEQVLNNARAALADAVRNFDAAVREVKQAVKPDGVEQAVRAIVDHGTQPSHVTDDIADATGWQPPPPAVNPRAGFDEECDDDRREEGITGDG